MEIHMSRPRSIHSLFRVVLALFLISFYVAAQGGSVHYKFGEVELKGVVVLKTEYGAPGFENDGESPKLQVKMLQLDQAISVEPKDSASREFDPVKSIKLIQLVALSGVDLSNLVVAFSQIENQLNS